MRPSALALASLLAALPGAAFPQGNAASASPAPLPASSRPQVAGGPAAALQSLLQPVLNVVGLGLGAVGDVAAAQPFAPAPWLLNAPPVTLDLGPVAVGRTPPQAVPDLPGSPHSSMEGLLPATPAPPPEGRLLPAGTLERLASRIRRGAAGWLTAATLHAEPARELPTLPPGPTLAHGARLARAEGLFLDSAEATGDLLRIPQTEPSLPPGAKLELRAVEARQAASRRTFLAARRVKPTTLARLPKGVPARYGPGLERIRSLLSSPGAFFDRITELEREVVIEALLWDVDRRQALRRVLARWESRHGFRPAIVLPAVSFRSRAWLRMLHRGALFDDAVFADAERNGRPHGSLTHRLQWHAVMREMERSPARFGDVRKASELFRFLGMRNRVALDWTGLTGEQSLWFRLFDTFENNFTSPEFTRRQHEYWPDLGHWD